MRTVSSYGTGHLRGTSFAGPPETLSHQEFDVGIFVSAWEERCTTVTRVSLGVKYAGLVRFLHDNGAGWEKEYNDRLDAHVRRIGHGMVELIEGRVSQEGTISPLLVDLVARAAKSEGRPVTVFVDISCCPKYYFLDLLGACMVRGLCSRMQFFYAAADYEQNTSPSGPAQPAAEDPMEFTSGPWETVAVSSFRGSNDAAKGRAFLISLGVEVDRVDRVLATYAPRQLGLLIADPGVNEKLTRIARKVNQTMAERYVISPSVQARAPAVDAIAAWKAVDQSPIHDRSHTVACLSFGTKPHALGMGLAAVVRPDIQIVYVRPQAFKRRDDKFSGTAWVYDVRDLSAIW